MPRVSHRLRYLLPLAWTLLTFLDDGMRFLELCRRSNPTLVREQTLRP